MIIEKLSVGIIGCGWLGIALAKKLISLNHTVVGTTRSEEKLPLLSQNRIIAEKLTLPLARELNESQALFHCNTVIISVTPGLRQGRVDYAENIKSIIEHAQRRGVEHVILLNSSSIYEGLNGYVDELSELALTEPKVQLLKQAEEYVEKFEGRYTIFRLSGLIGPKRHPGRFFNSGRILSTPNAFVNLIHQDDVVSFLVEFITECKPSGIYNASSLMEVSKGHFYNMAAHSLGLPPLEFDNSPTRESGKLIVSNKLRNQLNQPTKYDDLVSWMMTHKS